MMPKISIIVPVYNAGIHLKRCLDSLVTQTLKDIEIILVLDVPTDGSDKLAEKYAKKDSRIKLIYNKENLHTGFSRNEGIKYARAEFIGFADHDDYCDVEMFEKLYKKAVSDSADVVISNFFDEYQDVQYYFAFPEGYSDKEFQDKAFRALISGRFSKRNSHSFNNMNVIWNQIYRRTFLLKNNIFFPDNRKVTMEDVFFSLKVYHFATKVSYLPETYYHHVNTSSNNYDNYGYHSVAKVIPLLEEISTFLKENNIWEKYKDEFSICTLTRLYTSYRNEVKFKQLFHSFGFFKQVRSNAQLQNILIVIKNNKALIKKFPITKIFFLFIITK